MQELDDNALLREYVERHSGEAFAVLVARHVNKIYSAALRRTGNPGQAEEITQAVFVILARKSRALSKSVALSGWLYETTRLTAATLIRGEIRRARREKEAHMQALINEPEADVWHQIAPLLEAAVGNLSEADRQAVVLRFFDGKSMREVAQAMGATEDASKMRLSRAVEKLRQFFRKRGVNHSAELLTAAIASHSVQAAPASVIKSAVAIALAKGAASTGGATVLAGGTLRAMAWGKAKIAAVTGGTVLMVAALAIDLTGFHWTWFRGNPDVQGAWEGLVLLDYPGVDSDDSAASSHVVLKFVKTNDGYAATSDWIEYGRKDVPMGQVIYHYPTLEIVRTPRETWKLKVNADATQIYWDHYRKFIQPDPVLFLRTKTPDTVPDHLTADEFAPRDGSDLQGFWKGQLWYGTNRDPVNLKIAEMEDGHFRAEADGPMDGVAGAPLALNYQRPLVRFGDGVGSFIFQGAISNGGMEMIGSFREAGRSAPASFKRADYRAEHIHDAEKDYSCRSQDDLQGHWKGTWIGTIEKSKAPIRFMMDIAKMRDGTYAGTLANIDNFGEDAPVPDVELKWTRPNVWMYWGWKRYYDGVMKDGKIFGTWHQGGHEFPLVFERATQTNL